MSDKMEEFTLKYETFCILRGILLFIFHAFKLKKRTFYVNICATGMLAYLAW